MTKDKRQLRADGFTPLDCKWCYWESHVTTDESCICLFDACETGDPSYAFGLACDDWNEGCPCDEFERENHEQN